MNRSDPGLERFHRFQRLMQRLRGLHPPEQAVLLVTSVLVGLAAGAGAIFFRWMIRIVSWVCSSWLPTVTAGLGAAYLMLAPAAGGLLVGLLVYNFAPEARGHGVPEVMEAVALKNGRIRRVVAVIKSLASALCIGSGGSVGREGPIVQIGSAVGSGMGQALRLSGERVRNLVACGAAGGIAATFNAPIAGAMFALEVILGDFSIPAFGTVVVASVTASVVGRSAFGDVPAFVIPEYAINSAWEFPAYLVLGVLAAIVGVLFTRTVYGSEDLFERWRIGSPWLTPAVGGVALGGLALLYRWIPGLSFDVVPHIYGVGYDSIEAALRGQHAILIMVSLMGLKILGTGVTLGSGGSGGIFAPSLFIGSMLGGSVGLLTHLLFPDISGPVGAYALVGMEAVFAAATHASLTAILIMFELTGDHKIILPLMFAVVVATLVSRHFLKNETIYSLKLSRRGVRLRPGRNVDVLQRIRVSDAMTRQVVTVRPGTSIDELASLYLRSNRHAFSVLDGDGRLCGIVSLSDVKKLDEAGQSGQKRVGDIMTRSVTTAYSDETLDVVLARMGPNDLSRLPVVSREDPRELIAVVRHNDIVRAYNTALAREAHTG